MAAQEACVVSHLGREGKCSVTFGTSVVTDLLGWEEAAVANACHWSICEQAVLGSKHPALCTTPTVTLPAVSCVWYRTAHYYFFLSSVPCVLTWAISSYLFGFHLAQHCYQVMLVVNTFTAGLGRQRHIHLWQPVPETYWSPGRPGLPCLKTNKVHHDSEWYFNPILLLLLWHIWIITHCFLLEILVTSLKKKKGC